MNNKKSQRIFNQDVFKRDHIMLLNNKAQTQEEFIQIVMALVLPKCDKILLDLLWKAYQCAIEQRFSVEQIATFLSITNFIFIESFQAKMVHLESYALLKQILNNHTFQAPPFSLKIFKEEQVVLINKFMRNQFYRYKLIFKDIFLYLKQLRMFNVNIQLQHKDKMKIGQFLKIYHKVKQQMLMNLNYYRFKQIIKELILNELEQNNSDFPDQAIIKRVLETKDTKEFSHDKKLEESIDKMMIQNFNHNLTIEQRNAKLFDSIK